MSVCPVLSAISVCASDSIERHDTRSDTSLRNSPVLTSLPSPPLPAYFTSGSASHVRPHWWPSLYKSDQSPQTENIVTYFGILKRLWDPWEAFKGDSSTEKALVGCGSPREERSGSGGLNAPKSSQVTQLELFAGEEMSLIPNTFQHQYEASSFKIVLFKVNCTIWKKKLPSV